jgi:hypothetical protein
MGRVSDQDPVADIRPEIRFQQLLPWMTQKHFLPLAQSLERVARNIMEREVAMDMVTKRILRLVLLPRL